MQASLQDNSLSRLIKALGRLPGLGPRSARRIALMLLKKKEGLLVPLATAIQDVLHEIKTCGTCGNLDVTSPCAICADDKRDPYTLCVVADVADIWALERGQNYKGRYHVLGGILSAMDGVYPSDLSTQKLYERCAGGAVREVVLALSNTLDGQTTAQYTAKTLEPLGIKITRLAQGIPMGGELDYLDDYTLQMALDARLPLTA